MSQLLPDVSLDEDESQEQDETRSAEENPIRTDAPAGERDSSEREETDPSESLPQRTTELQNPSDRDLKRSSSQENKNYSSVEEQFSHESREQDPTARQPSAGDRSSGPSTQEAGQASPSATGLPVFPDERPDLSQKLGPYVSADVDDALEDVYLLLRRRFGAQASKSLVVEVALRYILRDCLDREEESELMRWFDRVLDT
jgi:hypothetical protein